VYPVEAGRAPATAWIACSACAIGNSCVGNLLERVLTE